MAGPFNLANCTVRVIIVRLHGVQNGGVMAKVQGVLDGLCYCRDFSSVESLNARATSSLSLCSRKNAVLSLKYTYIFAHKQSSSSSSMPIKLLLPNSEQCRQKEWVGSNFDLFARANLPTWCTSTKHLVQF